MTRPGNQIGTVAEAWRYPVKSMAGESLPALFAGFSGVYGDRMFAFTRPDGPAAFPYMTARQKAEMVLYRARLRDGRVLPANADAVMAVANGPTAIYADDAAVEVVTPEGETLAIEDARLAEGLAEGLRLLRSDRTMADCWPVSLLSLQTVRQLGAEMERAIDARRFRANLVIDLPEMAGFGEDALVGRTLRIGERVRLAVTERDGRCAMIGVDPVTAERDRTIPMHVTSAHEGRTGIYAAVLAEGVMRAGDAVVVE